MGRRLRRAGVLAALGTAGVWAYRRGVRPPRRRHPLLVGGPLLIAHRGGAGLAPENTLVAFRQAVRRWRADMIELDVHASADGECVVIHDPTVDRTTEGRGSVAELSLEHLQALDAGYRFTTDGGRSFPFRGRGVRIPTLGDVLAETDPVPLVVEIKSGRAQGPLLRTLRAAGAEDRVIIAGERSADRTLFADWPGALSAAREPLVRFAFLHRLHLSKLWRPVADVASLPEYRGGVRVLTPRLIRDLHERGLAVHVWTVDEVRDMERLLDWGVDGLITNRPDRLAEVLAVRTGRRAGPPAAGGTPDAVEEASLDPAVAGETSPGTGVHGEPAAPDESAATD